jgi:UDP-glucuronate 4-epimerase
MRVLVTGASGFIAAHLIPALLAQGHSVGACYRGLTTTPQAQLRTASLLELAKQYSALELLPLSNCNIDAVVAAFKPEACVHLAGMAQVRTSVEQPQLSAADHAFSVELLQALATRGCRRAVFASSVMVYGHDAPAPYREDAVGTAPASPYGASKLAGEAQFNTYAMLGKLETVNLRIFAAYGPEMNPFAVPYIIAKAILTQQPFTILGDGSSQRDYIEVADVVRAIELALHGQGSLPAVNIGTGQGTPLLTLVSSIEQCLNKKAVLVYKQALPGELAVAIPDVTLARQRLGFAAQIGLNAGMQRLAMWFSKNSAH